MLLDITDLLQRIQKHMTQHSAGIQRLTQKIC